MPIICCGVKYSKNDPDTYWCFESWCNTTPAKKTVKNERVRHEHIDSIVCKKCGALVIQINRYSNFHGFKKLIEKERLTGKNAFDFLEKTKKTRVHVKNPYPIQNAPYAKNIDFVYGKVTSPITQRKRYLNEQGWADGEVIKNECVSISEE